MKWSLSLGKPFGIGLFVHWTFLILIGWVVVSQWRQGHSVENILWMLAFVGVIFVCVTLHELGHALAARYYKIGTKSIILLPIGGVANLESIPEKPGQELVVAAAGPLVNVAIVLVLVPILWVQSMFTGYWIDPSVTMIGKENFLVALMGINVLMVLFNLIPAFPMDGGRILRALLAMRLDREKATRWAVSIGQFFAIAFAFWGLFNNPFLVLIAIFIWIAAQSEYMQVKVRSQLSGYNVDAILMKDYHAFDVNDTIQTAVNVILRTQYEHFLVMNGKEVVGTVTKNQVISALAENRSDASVGTIMDTNFEPLSPQQSLEDAFRKMQINQKTILPVISDNELVGVLDQENISEFLSVQRAMKSRQAEDALAGMNF